MSRFPLGLPRVDGQVFGQLNGLEFPSGRELQIVAELVELREGDVFYRLRQDRTS